MKQTVNVKDLLGDVFDELQEDLRDELSEHEYEQRRFDFVFHMTDGKKDLERLVDVLNRPDEYSTDELSTEMIGLLIHLLPHLNAAGRLLLDEIPDPFLEAESRS